MNQDLARPDLTGEVKVRLPLPIVIPIGAIVVIALVAIGMSQVLLSVPHEAAAIIATAVAINILGGFAVLATRPRITASHLAELFIVVTYPLLIGVVIASMGIGESHGATVEEGTSETGAAAAGGGNSIVAKAVAFESDTLTGKAGAKVTLTLDNQDTVPHNLSVYESEEGAEIAKGETAEGGAKVDTTVPPQKPGEYFFRCDLHPTGMTGTYKVE